MEGGTEEDNRKNKSVHINWYLSVQLNRGL